MKYLPVIKPPALRPGDAVGVIAPAGRVNESDLRPGLKILESSGFEVRLGAHLFDGIRYTAGNDAARLDDFHSMFLDRDIKAIFCARGGYGSMRLLDKINYGLIRENPKIILGYSDVTALLLAVQKRCGLATFHGPMVREFNQMDRENWEFLINILSAGGPLSVSLGAGKVLISGRATGRLVGGNLSLICHLLGTPFFPSLEGCILFLEEKGEAPYRLDRMLTHLALSGQLERLSGLVAGDFEECGDGAFINGLLTDIFSDLGIPLATGLPVGHGRKNLVLPIGITAELDTGHMTLAITETCVD